MNAENTRKLIEDFPEFWKHSDNLQISLMGFGFECGDGWFDLLHELFSKIQAEYDTWTNEERGRFYVVQVKEKWGALRTYVFGSSEKVQDLCWEYELKSETVCEQCGKPGVPRGGGWIQTLCDEHAGERIPLSKEEL